MTVSAVLPYVLGDAEMSIRHQLLAIDDLFVDGYRKNRLEILALIEDMARSNLLIPYFLKQGVAARQLINMIGAQCYLFHLGDNYLARMNFWPARSYRDSVISERVRRYFSINLLHNHSFDFFTVGVLGSGYYSKFYEVELADLEGRSVGDTICLRPNCELTLSQGRAIFVTKSTEFHSQYEPDIFSISLNFIPKKLDSVGSSDLAQFIVNPDSNVIERIIQARG